MTTVWGENAMGECGRDRLSCVLCIKLCPPGMQACFSLLLPPLSCLAQLLTQEILGTLMLMDGPELALTTNENAC